MTQLQARESFKLNGSVSHPSKHALKLVVELENKVHECNALLYHLVNGNVDCFGFCDVVRPEPMLEWRAGI
jgi:hypothetical protein